MQCKITLDSNHALVRNHQVYGRSMLPGLAYIDFLYSFFDDKGYDYKFLELTNLAIFKPLVVEKNGCVHLKISADSDQDGNWKLVVSGISKAENCAKGDKKTYAKANMSLIDKVEFTEKIDLPEEKKTAKEVINIEEIYADCRERKLVHKGLMKTKGKLFKFRDKSIVSVAVESKYRQESLGAMFQPAILDGSAIALGSTLLSDNEDASQLFLPLSYGSFRACALIDKSCSVRTVFSSIEKNGDYLKCNIDYFNRTGRKVAELNGMIAKLATEISLATAIDGDLSAELGDGEKSQRTPRSYTKSADIEKLINSLLAEKLGVSINQIKKDVGFYEMGFHSEVLLELVAELESELGLELPPTLLFEHPTISGLLKFLAKSIVVPSESARSSTPDDSQVAYSVGNTACQKENDLSIEEPHSRSELKGLKGGHSESDIAVIGISGRFPSANRIQEYWENLKNGRDCITEIPEERWDFRDFYSEKRDQSDKTNCKWGGFIDEVDQFDALFFDISPRMAKLLDFKEKLFLEAVWVLLESANITKQELKSKYKRMVGVYAGAMYQESIAGGSDMQSKSVSAINSYSSIANRVSHFFELQGPSIAVDTACSSSATAIHMACESLNNGGCELAIAGGVNLSLTPHKYVGLSQMQLLGSNNNNRSFSDGDGYIPCEAVAAVLLKPLSVALRDGDDVYGVIKSTSTNHDGNYGYGVPDVSAQVQVMNSCIRKAKIDSLSISHVETAANGSLLGDSMEFAALTKVFHEHSENNLQCAIGSVKSNIGHAEAASGVSQLIKVILELKHKTLTPSVKLKSESPYIKISETPFFLVDEKQDWSTSTYDTTNGLPRRALINSFGAGGSNVSMIVEEHTAVKETSEGKQYDNNPHIVVFSAKSSASLENIVRNMIEYLTENADISLAKLAYTLQVGREHMPLRLALLVREKKELRQGLESWLSGKELVMPRDNSEAKIYYADLDVGLDEDDEGSQAQFEIDRLIESAVEDRDYDSIAIQWTKGEEINWSLLYENGMPCKISLPTYHFKKDCFPYENTIANSEHKADVEKHIVLPEVEIILDDEAAIEKHMIGILAKHLDLKTDDIKLNKTFQSYGLDSITGIELCRKIEKAYSIKISMRQMAELKTLSQFSTFITESLRENYEKVGAKLGREEDIVEVAQSDGAKLGETEKRIVLNQFKAGEISLEQLKRELQLNE